MLELETVADFDKDAYDVLSTQLSYRRERRHAVFRWCSSILVASIGGLVAFAKTPLHSQQELIVRATIVILAVFTMLWMWHHWNIEKKIQEQIDHRNNILGIQTFDSTRWCVDWMQTLAVLGLAITAWFAASYSQ